MKYRKYVLSGVANARTTGTYRMACEGFLSDPERKIKHVTNKSA